MRMLRALLAGAFLVVASTALARPPSARVVEYGRYRSDVVGERLADGTSGGVTLLAVDPVHVETTATIQARVGEEFAILLQFFDLPSSQPYVVREETHHPPIRQPGGRVLTNSVTTTTVRPGRDPTPYYGWVFAKGYEYELVPGTWTKKVFVNDVEVASFSFEVVR